MTKQHSQPGENLACDGASLASATKRILVVDDDTAVRTTLSGVLAGEGYTAVPAAGGLQAVALAAITPVDLVLLDINLMGQNGWDTFENLASAHPALPIIVITAKPGQNAQANRLRADALMEKPLNLPLLLENITRFLAESETQRARRRNDPGFETCILKAMARRTPEGDYPRNRHTPTGGGPPGEKAGGKTGLATKRKRILVVDDDVSVRQMLGRILTDEGYLVGEAANGEQALAIVAQERFDLMLLDLNMPVKNGWDTFERLTTENPLLPVIIITARANQRFTALGAGVGALMEKPLDFPKLLHTISVLLAEAPEVQLARMSGKRAGFYYHPAGQKSESHENHRSHHKLAGE